MTPKYRVRYTEYEHGWGNKPCGFEDFDSFDAAHTHQKNYNTTHNSSLTVPSYYIIAENPVLVDTEITKD